MIVRRAFLDLSTGHLREETCQQLGSYEGVIAHHLPHGWLMVVPDIDDQHDADHWPDELAPIVELARIHGCDYVLFDADAEPADELSVFDW